MSLSKRWTNWSVKLHAKTAQSDAAVYIDQVRSQGINANLVHRLEASSGSAYATYGSLVSGAPAFQFDTTDLKAFLDECGTTGMEIDADGTHPGVVAYWQRMADYGTRDAADAGTHISATFPNGVLVPLTLDMAHQGDAVLSAAAYAVKSGDTDPFTLNEAADLPSSVYPTTDALWTLGPLKLNTTTVEGLTNARIDFGIAVSAEGADSDVYPTHITFPRIQPVITVSGVHADVLSTLTEDGNRYTASQIVLWAKKRASGGTFTANATEEHIKFTLGVCTAEWTALSGDPASVAMQFRPLYTPGGSPVYPMTIDTTAAIS